MNLRGCGCQRGVTGIPDERAMDRWFALEMARLHRAFVAQPRPVAELWADAAPTAATKGGEVHRYDVATVRRIHDALSPLARRRVRLPVTFIVHQDTPSDAHVADEPAIELLRALGEISPEAKAREGKIWMGLTRARLIAERYPGAFQFVYF